jgi:predicted transcriptional regulator
MRKPLPKPTDAELGILQVLWRERAATVKEVQQRLASVKLTLHGRASRSILA